MNKDIAVTRLLPNICTHKMEETREFYRELLGFVVGFEHEGWYIQMASPEKPELQIGIMRLDHEFTPQPFQRPAQGVIISVQVEDIESTYAAVKARSFELAQDICVEEFGMKRFMVADPNGLLINMFSFS